MGDMADVSFLKLLWRPETGEPREMFTKAQPRDDRACPESRQGR